MKTYSISKKKTDALYKVVNDDIMDARIQISCLMSIPTQVGKVIDNILSTLQKEAPQKAIDLFKVKSK